MYYVAGLFDSGTDRLVAKTSPCDSRWEAEQDGYAVGLEADQMKVWPVEVSEDDRAVLDFIPDSGELFDRFSNGSMAEFIKSLEEIGPRKVMYQALGLIADNGRPIRVKVPSGEEVSIEHFIAEKAFDGVSEEGAALIYCAVALWTSSELWYFGTLKMSFREAIERLHGEDRMKVLMALEDI